ncbi:MAG TPA: hypothetical protein VHL79_11140 [Ramlibacter sp.]|jgi:hypothetical protein|nr:hypothetical protein [Ramlibacter sp.]
MQAKIRSTVAAVMLLAPVAATFVTQPVAAQQRAAPSITNMSLNSDGGLSPGATLRVQVYATANARSASLQLGESGITVPLRQQTAGNYTGTYVVRRSDRIDPTELLTARVTFDRTYSRSFNYPPGFQALAMGAAPQGSAAPQAAAPQRLAVDRFVMRPMGRIEAGRELRFRLRGAPGADAWMDIPGVINGIDLAEVRPGVYEGTYTVRRRDNPDAFRNAVATLRSGNQRATARLDLNGRDDDDRQPTQARDDRAPQITDLFPDNGARIGERGRAEISARLADEGSGIDPAGVRMRLNGRDVTGDARVSPDEIRYRADLPPGRYTAEVTARDQAGNQTIKTWTFDVTAGGDAPRDRVGSGPVPLQLTSHNNNAVVDGNGNLALRGRTAPFANVRVQVDSVASVGGMLGLTQPVADQTVQADANGNFNVVVSPRGLPIPGTRYDVRLTATSGSQTAEERITLIQRQG